MADTADTLGNKPRFDRRSAAPLHLVDGEGLVVEVSRLSARTARVSLGGELDMMSAPKARLVLAAADSIGCRDIELDLSGLTFCDAAGLRVFVDAQHACAEHGGLLLLIDPGRAVMRVISLAGLAHLLSDCRT